MQTILDEFYEYIPDPSYGASMRLHYLGGIMLGIINDMYLFDPYITNIKYEKLQYY